MSLSQGISKFHTKVLITGSNSCNKIVEDYFVKHVTLSPKEPSAAYAKGLLINSWFPAVGKSPSTIVGTTVNMEGADSIDRIKGMLAQNPFWGKNNTVTLSNNISYAYRADKIGWPRGLDAPSGWNWSGNVGPYMMTSLAKAYIMRLKT
jgi:hypothetical protein